MIRIAKNSKNYDDIALIMAAVISVVAILGLVLFLKGGLTGKYFATKESQIIEIIQPAYKGSADFYCNPGAYALWTRNAVDAVLKLDYSCTVSDVNKDVTCCYPPQG